MSPGGYEEWKGANMCVYGETKSTPPPLVYRLPLWNRTERKQLSFRAKNPLK